MVRDNVAVSITGEEIRLDADSLCIHGDTPGAVEMAKRIRNALEDSGVKVVQMTELVV